MRSPFSKTLMPIAAAAALGFATGYYWPGKTRPQLAPRLSSRPFAALPRAPKRVARWLRPAELRLPLGQPGKAAPSCSNSRAATALAKARSAFGAHDYTRALNIVSPFAGQDCPAAEEFLGGLHEAGFGVPKDAVEAARWYRKAAELGYAKAQVDLGVMYENGAGGVPRDYGKAAAWYRKAAEAGDARAQEYLADMYAQGEGMPRNFKEASLLYERAAQQGYAPSQNALGALYEHGRGVKMDKATAFKWYLKAARQGYAPAQLNVGTFYDNGYAVSQDFETAVKWYRKAADQGNRRAQRYLADMYKTGRGVRQDPEEAALWRRKALENSSGT